MEDVTGKMHQNARQSAIEETRPIRDLNQVHPAEAEPEVVVSDGGGTPLDSKQTAPFVTEEGGAAAGLSIDLNAEIRSLLSDNEIQVPNQEIFINGGGEDGGDREPRRKRLRYAGDDGGYGDGEPSDEINYLRLLGFDMNSNAELEEGDGGASGFNAAAAAGGDSPTIETSELGFRWSDDDDVSTGGAEVDDGGESPIQQPRGGLRLFGHDIN